MERRMKLPKLNAIKISPQTAVPIVFVFAATVIGVEWRALYQLDHPKPENVSCIGCHSDKKTLEAMADKAGDRLYLVHSGQLTRAKLDSLLSKPDSKISKTYK
jgi:hypothetical protein